ncbi:MAG TPA: hypothetical protein PLL30_12540 [Candidatus Krumholzibacteria bacterium]|nr:hypothetical protein [Candidatus Krumholzibacteria bacterium]HPD72597.1 hypothetical protein [Candidatus Krumholzibacteria bacterium]HRY40471.1 hypothetical protein [Candidatus Krumholzibacteria bacterium]
MTRIRPCSLATGALCLFLGVCSPTLAGAKIIVPRSIDTATVVLVGGWEFPGVAVRWSDADAGLWVTRADGARRLYQPEEIVRLRDASGRDVTAEVLPPWALQRLAIEAPPAAPRGETAFAPPAAGPQPAGSASDDRGGPPGPPSGDWRAVWGVEAGYSRPHDLDLLDSDGGLGLDAQARVRLAGPIYLAGGYSWHAIDRVSTGLAPSIPDPGEEPGSAGLPPAADARIAGVWAGLSLIARGEDDEAARFYLEGGIGRYTTDGLDVRRPADAYLGYHGGLGFLVPLGAAVALDLGARATQVVNLDLGYGDDVHTLFGVRLGLAFLAR